MISSKTVSVAKCSCETQKKIPKAKIVVQQSLKKGAC